MPMSCLRATSITCIPKYKPVKMLTRWLTHMPAGVRHAIARLCKGKTFPGAWHLYANLAPAEESFIGQARVRGEAQSELGCSSPNTVRPPSVQMWDYDLAPAREGQGVARAPRRSSTDMHADARRHPAQGRIKMRFIRSSCARRCSTRAMSVGRTGAHQVPINDENTVRVPSGRVTAQGMV